MVQRCPHLWLNCLAIATLLRTTRQGCGARTSIASRNMTTNLCRMNHGLQHSESRFNTLLTTNVVNLCVSRPLFAQLVCHIDKLQSTNDTISQLNSILKTKKVWQRQRWNETSALQQVVASHQRQNNAQPTVWQWVR